MAIERRRRTLPQVVPQAFACVVEHRRDSDDSPPPTWRGQQGALAGGWRPQNGAKTGGRRSAESDVFAENKSLFFEKAAFGEKTHVYGPTNGESIVDKPIHTETIEPRCEVLALVRAEGY